MVLIVHPDKEGDDLTAVVEDVESLIDRNDGRVLEIEPWGLRKLAYPIKKQQEGYYFVLQSDMEPQSVAEIDRNLRLMEPVIRHLIVRTD
jgi:small subunit ribosomal protein S6